MRRRTLSSHISIAALPALCGAIALLGGAGAWMCRSHAQVTGPSTNTLATNTSAEATPSSSSPSTLRFPAPGTAPASPSAGETRRAGGDDAAAKLPEAGRYTPKLSSLATAPDWKQLEPYQRTMTREEFVRWIDQIYAPSGAFWRYAEIDAKAETLTLYGEAGPAPATNAPASAAGTPPATNRPAEAPSAPPAPRTRLFTLHFARDATDVRPRPVHFRPEKEAPWTLPPRDPAKPLDGVRILLDPGHIGGDWAGMEERFFQLGVGKPAVVEGDLTWDTCYHVERELKALGADVAWTKGRGEPSTPLRPKDLRDAAIKLIADGSGYYPTPPTAQDLVKRLNREANSLFYRTAEIRARAVQVPKFKPDLIICVHYNASPWGYERRAMLNDVDRLVVFVNGMYSLGELANDDQKFAVMFRVLARITPLELNVSDRVSAEMAASLGLPPETYRGSQTMRQMGANPYVFARNLLANRIFDAPVVYVEGPYMNSKTSYPRFVAGDYEGERKIDGKMVPSLLREMAQCITRGVVHYFTQPPRNLEGKIPLAGPSDWPWPPTTNDLVPAPLPPFPPPPPPRPPSTNAPATPPAPAATNAPPPAETPPWYAWPPPAATNFGF